MVERIKELCKIRNISLYKLEKELGFGNGTIGKWGSRVPNYTRLKAVADYFGVSVDELTGEPKEKPPAQGGEPLHTIKEWEAAIDKMSQEDRKAVMEILMKKFIDNG